jgi:Protein of unknown function (DUF2939)
MRWALWIAVFLCIVLCIYFASPFFALQRIATAVETRDAVAVTERVDFPALRRSLTKQIVATYLKLTGKKLPLGAIGKGFAFSVADPIVARLMTVNALLDLLAKGDAGNNVKVQIDKAPFSSASLRSIWQLWLNSHQWGRDFYIHLPPEGSRNEQFRVHLRLSRWHWKIVGVDLPESLKDQLAQELVELTRERIRAPN